ncbi:MAG: SpoIID/LytB domain-containing protein [Chloroflexi bacterium]|nr:SpoIID/LytB domain-containing protein [Chloroflexota bacterium]
MRLPIVLRLALIALPALLVLAALPVFAQTGATGPRRLTSDGRSTPAAWDAAGLRVTRPGALIESAGVSRIASELWRLDTANGAAVLLSPDAPQTGRAPVGAGGVRVYVVNPGSLDPELWIANADGSNARLLLRGSSEYFFDPVVSPDGRQFAFVRTPTGSETHVTSAIWAGQADGRNVRRLIAEASAPVWSPDSAQLAFEHRGDVYVTNVSTPVTKWPEPLWLTINGGPAAPSAPTAPGALTPPSIIRVLHAKGNYDFSQVYACTNPSLATGTIVTIPFETYVSWVVPIEASASNPPEHLKAQAVAARTYAWKRVNYSNPWDVSDWTDTQAMCPLRADPRSDAATAATAGQYIAYTGQLIHALYSAENGDPTKKNPFQPPGNCPACAYLDAVDDPVSWLQTVSGHGAGFSQKGSQRWAGRYGWNYIQILMHYYSNVTIEGPTTFGSLIAPWSGWYQTSNRVRAAGAANNVGTFNMYAVGVGLSGTQFATNTVTSALDVSALPDQLLGSLVISGTLGGTRVATQTVGLDRQLPTGTVTVPATTTISAVTLVISGTDSGPSGYAGYGVSYGWVWEGEDKVAGCCVAGVGMVVTDAAALNGKALYAPNGSGGVWYGPYTYALPFPAAYRAYFRMKVGNNLTTTKIAKIDVVADGWNPIGITYIYGTDFRVANAYQEFYVDVDHWTTPTMGVEFRVDFPGTTDLWLDRVLVATYPSTSTAPVMWVLTPTLGVTQTVIVKFSDMAGNVSADVPASTVYTLPNRVYLPAILAP